MRPQTFAELLQVDEAAFWEKVAKPIIERGEHEASEDIALSIAMDSNLTKQELALLILLGIEGLFKAVVSK